MRAAVPAPAANERSPKSTPTAEKRLTLIREAAQHYRHDLGLSRRDADLLIRLATRHHAVAVALRERGCGSVVVPEGLRPYMGGLEVIEPVGR